MYLSLRGKLIKINTEAVEKSFETKVGDNLLSNLEIIDLELPSINEPDDAKEAKRKISYKRINGLKEILN